MMAFQDESVKSLWLYRMGTILPWDDDFDVLMDEDSAELILNEFNRTVRTTIFLLGF